MIRLSAVSLEGRRFFSRHSSRIDVPGFWWYHGAGSRNKGGCKAMTVTEIMGQIMGLIAVVLGFLSFQMRTQKQLLAVQIITTIAFSIHYFLIGAASGAMMNLLGIARNLAYYYKEKPLFSGKKCPIFFTVLMGIVGLTSWQGYYSIFVVVGLMINTACLSLSDPQKIRASILVSSPLVLIYDAFVHSIGGMVYESIVIVSSVIGIVRYRKQRAEKLEN